MNEKVSDRDIVLNDPINKIDPDGLDWMFHSNDHGGPHFQKGHQRYDAKSLDPIKHKGKTPPELSKSGLKRLKKTRAWGQMHRYFQNIRSAPILLLFPGQEEWAEEKLKQFYPPSEVSPCL
ncbi:MAG: hypothetical protein GY857_13305 [Desulfobacula sp.]|nr:hypothetical protein [Desulfobacula sp.]